MLVKWIIFSVVEFVLVNVMWNRLDSEQWVWGILLGVVAAALPVLLIRVMSVSEHGVITFLEKPLHYLKPGPYITLPFVEEVVKVTKHPIVKDYKAIRVVTGQGMEMVVVPDPDHLGQVVKKQQVIGRYEIPVDYTLTLHYPTGRKLVKAIPFIPKNPEDFAKDVKGVIDAAVFQFASTQVWFKLLDKVTFSNEVALNVINDTDRASVVNKYQIGPDELSVQIKNLDLPPEAEQALLAVEKARLKAVAAPALAQEDKIVIRNLIHTFGGSERDKDRAAMIMAFRGLPSGNPVLVDPARFMPDAQKSDTNHEPTEVKDY